MKLVITVVSVVCFLLMGCKPGTVLIIGIVKAKDRQNIEAAYNAKVVQQLRDSVRVISKASDSKDMYLGSAVALGSCELLDVINGKEVVPVKETPPAIMIKKKTNIEIEREKLYF